MKKFSILLIVAGIVVLGFAGYELFQSNQAQSDSLVEAQALLDESKTIDNDLDNEAELVEEFDPLTGDTAGILHIPELEADLPIVEGTHEDELAKGVGHYSGTAYPRQDDQIVLSGHRDTVFRRMGELDIGDMLTIQLPYGDFSYEIVETQIVDADDRSIIVPTGKEVLTLTTCYPFSYVGNAPDRYIITALPITENN